MSFLAPLFLVGLAAVAVPIFVHLIQRERRNVVEFPSLMFIRRIPFQSVERRRIHNWWLLLLRLAALMAIVAAFARPFFKVDPVEAAARATGAREVVILLDRSASMGYGDHWARAQAEARTIVAGLSGEDRATLVLFDDGPEEAVRATSDRGTLDAAIGDATVSSGATRFAPALRLAQSKLSMSDRARKEAYLISDFQKTGWARQEEIHLPQGATVAPVSVGDLDTSNVSVTSVSLARATFSGEERVTITAGLVNRSGTPVTRQPVRLEVDGRVVASRDVSIAPNATGSVTFDPLTISEPNIRGVIRAGTDAMPKDNDFYFVLSPARPVSVLVLQNDAADRGESLYLTTVLDLSKTPAFKTDVVTASRVTAGQLEGRSLVVVNDAALSSPTADLLRAFVERGGGVFLVLGDRNPAPAGWRPAARDARRAGRPAGIARWHARVPRLQPSRARRVQGPAQRQLRQHPVPQVPDPDAGADRPRAGALRRRRGRAGRAPCRQRARHRLHVDARQQLERHAPTRRCTCRSCIRSRSTSRSTPSRKPRRRSAASSTSRCPWPRP